MFAGGGILLGFFSCSDLNDIESRLEKLERNDDTPKVLSMSFKASQNPYQLINDVECEVIGDSVIECWVRNIMPNKELIPHIEYIGDKIYVENSPIISDKSQVDFKTPVTLTVRSEKMAKEYMVYVYSFTGLPVMWIETEGRKQISSKDEYMRASFKLVEDIQARGAGDIFVDSVNIKGRGNTTWGMPKKPYRLKFDKKTSLLGEAKDKSWVLLANYADNTALRNHIAFYMGSISNLEYTPKSHFVELMLNNRYNGTYQLVENLKISKDRVNVGDDGFLMEIDFRAPGEDDARYFRVENLYQPVNIKDPDVEYNDNDYNYAKNFVTIADSILFSSNFTDVNEGWQKYMDINSFVDWYLINEIARNNDAILYSSCYMNLKRGGKLKMGPLWDFDLAFGNYPDNDNYKVEGFWLYKEWTTWYYRLFQDPVFVQKVKERFNYFYDHRDDIMNEINNSAHYLRYSIEENENKWNTFYRYTFSNTNIWGCYQNEVQLLKTWLNSRFEWLKVEYDKM